ncbi:MULTISPECIES: cobyric acid synthase [unclassified Methanoregula]|uniref:cobyric acid synthase n=1 Tax=unclassified Methanoregula TaxID=2649730 RepID=UPI0009C90937|nr:MULTISPECIES: cobyric acid synthase [unclassified Methanoregula]OPX64484.1 MAG: cobyric acid synthase [Methanoregula sp. PtaB.Bin085]OPY35883.1 MAG: cobyric acid synthase [Methanoregula sp. PtaU1.Bin006]
MSLFVMGTSSHVGKSITVAAICRCLLMRGIPVAPFKSQNMSLNSFVTPDGGEIGMAQAMQASAAGVHPHTDMNPVLLKPKGDCVSQVVLNGRPYKDVPITEYYRETPFLLQKALESFARLADEYGQVVVEGAGGAAELNLYDRDIANILLARALKIPVILVADIERGGVFAQVYGTLALLPDDIRQLVRGIIINKFRGDPAIFATGVSRIEELCGIPVLGVVPYFSLPLPSEDSLSLGDKRLPESGVRIAVVRLPRIANFTDFELLEQYASVEYIQPGTSLDGYDCIIIPGTKNTVDDLLTLRQTEMDREIIRARESGVPVIGICGGYQMLGKTLIDAGYESAAGTYEGLGLLDCTTCFASYDKTTTQVTRNARPVPPILSSMGRVTGYEIHMGKTGTGSCREALEGDGLVSSDGLVFGTYMHGIFQNPNAANALLSYLHTKKGLLFEPIPDASCDPYVSLAAVFEEHVDMDRIVRILNEKPAVTTIRE